MKNFFVLGLSLLISACSPGSNYRQQTNYHCLVTAINFSVLEKDIILHDSVYYELEETDLPPGVLFVLDVDVDMGTKWGFLAIWRTRIDWMGQKLEAFSTEMPGNKREFSEVFRSRSSSTREPSVITLEKSSDSRWYGTFYSSWYSEDKRYKNSTHDLKCEEK